MPSSWLPPFKEYPFFVYYSIPARFLQKPLHLSIIQAILARFRSIILTILQLTTIMASSSLSINPSLSPSYLFTTTTTTTSSPSTSSLSFKVSAFSSSRAKPICLNCQSAGFFTVNSQKSRRKLQGFGVEANNSNMTISEVREEEEENPPLLDSENNSRPRRIALFVEPSPFA